MRKQNTCTFHATQVTATTKNKTSLNLIRQICCLLATLALLVTQQNGLISYISFLHYLPSKVPVLHIRSLFVIKPIMQMISNTAADNYDMKAKLRYNKIIF